MYWDRHDMTPETGGRSPSLEFLHDDFFRRLPSGSTGITAMLLNLSDMMDNMLLIDLRCRKPHQLAWFLKMTPV